MMEGGCKGCCVNPHGWLSIVGMFMALLSWGLSIGVHATCFFVRADNLANTGFGLWTRENPGLGQYKCQEYEYAESALFDTKWQSAAGLAFTAGCIGFIFTVLLIGTSCAAFHPAFFQLLAVFFVIAGILDFCTLVGLGSSICESLTAGSDLIANQCTFSTGAGLAVGAGICYFITAGIVSSIPPAKGMGGDDAAVPDTVPDDGTKEVVTTTNEGGSKTVEQTVTPPTETA